MTCPSCSAPRTRIIESRDDLKWMAKRRRRVCAKCSLRWNTLEIEEDVLLALVRHAPTAARATSPPRTIRISTAARAASNTSREPF